MFAQQKKDSTRLSCIGIIKKEPVLASYSKGLWLPA
jgi:hypothetical protein